MPVRGAILDVDGTLVDSNDAHTRAWVEAFAENNIEVDYMRIRSLIGMGSDNLIPEVTGLDEDVPKAKAISEAWSRIFEKKYLDHLQAFPKTKQLLSAMKDAGLMLVVASSAEKDMLKKLLKIAEADGLVEKQTSADDAKKSKPDPGIIAAALEQSGLEASEVLMLGDTPYDVEAAEKLGIGTVGLRCGGWDSKGLHGAVAVYDDPADLLDKLKDSPFLR